MFFWLGRVEQALDAIDRGIEEDPRAYMLHGWRVWYLSHLPGACDQIRDALARFVELSDDTADAWQSETVLHARALFDRCPDLYDPATALARARQAVEFNSERANYQDTWGVVLYREARYAEAREALLKGAELHRSLDNVVNLFFLAMTSWQLGEKNEARSYYDRALARMQATYPKNPDSIKARDEAARLLGIGR